MWQTSFDYMTLNSYGRRRIGKLNVRISSSIRENDAEACLQAGSDHCTSTSGSSSLREIGSSIAAAAGVATFHVVGENYDVRPPDLPAVPLFSRGLRVPGSSVVGIVLTPGSLGLVSNICSVIHLCLRTE